jgi:hypothetical protein
MQNRNLGVLTLGLCLSFNQLVGATGLQSICAKNYRDDAPTSVIETPAYLRVEGQADLPISFYESLRQELKTWVNEDQSGRRFQKIFLENRSFDPSHHFADGKSLFELAACADEGGMLFRRILKAGLNPYAKEKNGRNILIELLEQQNDPALKNAIITLVRGGVLSVAGETLEKAPPKNDFWSLYDAEKYLRQIRPEDFLLRDESGKIKVNWIEKLNPLFKDILIESVFRLQNQEMIEFLMGPMGLRSFGNKKGMSFLQMALLSRKSENPGSEEKSDAILRLLIEKFSVDVSGSFVFADGRGDGVIRPPILNVLIRYQVAPQLIELALKRGANPNAVDADGMNAMSWAVYIRSQKQDDRYVEILKKFKIPMPSILNQLWLKKPTGPMRP